MYIYISVITLVFVLNISGFFLAFFLKTDKFTDLVYSLSFIASVFYILFQTENKSTFIFVLGLLILIWAFRLGTFLFLRIGKIKRDKRFDSMRASFIKFGSFWLLQSISIIILLLPILHLSSNSNVEFTWINFLSILIFLAGFMIEVVADFQKSKFKLINPDRLFKEGLFSVVRYPNYLGEILIWASLWLYGIQYYSDWAWLTVLSPLWIFILLRYISGIPLVESKRNDQLRGDKSYEKYKKETPLLIPFS